jgi:hypothetical protein
MTRCHSFIRTFFEINRPIFEFGWLSFNVMGLAIALVTPLLASCAGA